MAEYTIKNEFICASFNSKGAELRSLKYKNSKEYMWSGDEKYWNRVSPVLFPFIGKCNNMQYTLNQKTYDAPVHGFVRDADFLLLSQTENEIWFYTEHNEKTLEIYPYKFRLELGYKLCENSLKVLYHVINLSENKLPFSIGGHPAFVCPPNENMKQNECYLKFDKFENLQSSNISENGLFMNETTPLNCDCSGFVKITKDLINLQTVLLINNQCNEISLCTSQKKPYVTVNFDCPVVALWTPVTKNAPFFCIEPWYGVCDKEGFNGEITEKEFENIIEPNSEFNGQYTITLFEI